MSEYSLENNEDNTAADDVDWIEQGDTTPPESQSITSAVSVIFSDVQTCLQNNHVECQSNLSSVDRPNLEKVKVTIINETLGSSPRIKPETEVCLDTHTSSQDSWNLEASSSLPFYVLDDLLEFPTVPQTITAYPAAAPQKPGRASISTQANKGGKAPDKPNSNTTKPKPTLTPEKKTSKPTSAKQDALAGSRPGGSAISKPTASVTDKLNAVPSLTGHGERQMSYGSLSARRASAKTQQLGNILSVNRIQREEKHPRFKKCLKSTQECWKSIHDFVTSDSIVCVTFILLLAIVVCLCIVAIAYPILKALKDKTE